MHCLVCQETSIKDVCDDCLEEMQDNKKNKRKGRKQLRQERRQYNKLVDDYLGLAPVYD